MNIIKIGNKDINIAENWDEITLEGFHIIKMMNDQKNDLVEMQMITMLFTAISDLTMDDIKKMYEEDFIPLIPIIEKFKLDSFTKTKKTEFTFNDVNGYPVLYTTIIPERLTMGEVITQKILDKNATSVLDKWTTLLSILISPAIESTNEFGEKVYTPIEATDDTTILNKRKELFKKIPAVNAMWIIDAFMNGRKTQQ